MNRRKFIKSVGATLIATAAVPAASFASGGLIKGKNSYITLAEAARINHNLLVDSVIRQLTKTNKILEELPFEEMT